MADTWLGEQANRGRRTFDNLLELRDIADGAETSTQSETAVAFDCRRAGDYVCVIDVSAIDYTTTNETYVFTVEVSDTSGGTYTAIGALPTIGALGVGKYVIPLSGEIAQAMDADADWIRITCTLGGTSPSITYGAYLAPAGGV